MSDQRSFGVQPHGRAVHGLTVSPPRRLMPQGRRGMAAIVMVIVLVLISLVVVGMVVGGGRDQVVVTRRLESIQAFYAAEAGMHMAIREMQEGNDEDGDGTEGTISDDGNSANDPTLGTGKVVVTLSTSGSTHTLVSTGRCGDAVRVIEVDLE